VVIHWPARIKAKGEISPQCHHLIDIAPAVLEAAELPQPKGRHGTKQKTIEGVSMVYSFNDGQAKSPHTIQYIEFRANRSVYKDGWFATALHKVASDAAPRTPLDQDICEPCNTADDFSSGIDVSAKCPDKLKELQAAFLTEAVGYNVLPLDDRVYARFNPAVTGRAGLMAGCTSLTVYEDMVWMKENTLIVNGKNVASGRLDHTIPFLFGAETADVGVELHTPVTKRDNKFTGAINR
jgi:hypothetical protein